MIAAGVNLKALSEFLGHASIAITLDRYGHLLPGSIAEATALLDAYLGRGLPQRSRRTDWRTDRRIAQEFPAYRFSRAVSKTVQGASSRGFKSLPLRQ